MIPQCSRTERLSGGDETNLSMGEFLTRARRAKPRFSTGVGSTALGSKGVWAEFRRLNGRHFQGGRGGLARAFDLKGVSLLSVRCLCGAGYDIFKRTDRHSKGGPGPVKPSRGYETHSPSARARYCAIEGASLAKTRGSRGRLRLDGGFSDLQEPGARA